LDPHEAEVTGGAEVAMGTIACPNCGERANDEWTVCPNCGANPQTGEVPEGAQAHSTQFAEHVDGPQLDKTKRSRFLALPATLLGRVSAGLFVGLLVAFVASIILDAGRTGHDLSLTIGSVNVVLPIVVAAVCGMVVTGAVALIRYHERSWAVWVSTLLIVLLMAAEMVLAALGSG
jgi:hypothetical protein